MALKTKDVIIEHGDDKGKAFRITRMPTVQADRWANKALVHLAHSGFDLRGANIDLLINTIDPKVKDSEKIDKMGGMLELVRVLGGFISGVPFEIVQELKDELLDCVEIIPSGGMPRKILSINDEIECPSTLEVLRYHAFQLHVGFLMKGSL